MTVLDADSNVVAASKGEVLARYVRRELRDLTDSDRDRWLDALATMWRVEGSAGRDTSPRPARRAASTPRRRR